MVNKLKVWILDGADMDHSLEIELYNKNNIEYLISNEKSFVADYEKFGMFADVINSEASISLSEEYLKNLQNCKLICSFGIGFDHIDLEAAKRKKIKVVNLPDYCTNEVSEHTITLILLLLRRIPSYHNSILNHKWNSISEVEIRSFSNITIGLIGFGNIARLVSKKLKSLGFKIIATDDYVDQQIFLDNNVDKMTLEEVLLKSDLISLHVPLTDSTKGMINKDTLRKMKKGSYIVNTCRGGIINELDLNEVIESKHLAGAALDVFSSEPPNFNSPIFSNPEIIFTPHAAYYSSDSIKNMQLQVYKYVEKVLENEKIISLI